MEISVTESTFKKNLKLQTGLNIVIVDMDSFLNELREAAIFDLKNSILNDTFGKVVHTVFDIYEVEDISILAFSNKAKIESLSSKYIADLISSDKLSFAKEKVSLKRPTTKTIENAEKLKALQEVMSSIGFYDKEYSHSARLIKSVFIQELVFVDLFKPFLTGRGVLKSSSSVANALSVPEGYLDQEKLLEYKHLLVKILKRNVSQLEGYLSNNPWDKEYIKDAIERLQSVIVNIGEAS